MNFSTKSKIRGLQNEILDINKRILYRESLGVSEEIIKPLRNQMEMLEEQLNKLDK